MDVGLLTVMRLSRVEPTLLLLALGSAVPSLAAVVVCALARPSLVRQLFARFRIGMPWRKALASYGLLFAIAIGGSSGHY